MDRKIIKEIINEILQKYGYKKKGNSWYKKTAECIVVFNLQHSSYGNIYYVNLAALLRKGNDQIICPKEYQCDVRMRFPISEIDGFSTQEILDLDSPISDDVRKLLIEHIIYASMPFLKKLESLDQIIELYKEKPELDNIYPLSSILYRRKINNSDNLSL